MKIIIENILLIFSRSHEKSLMFVLRMLSLVWSSQCSYLLTISFSLDFVVSSEHCIPVSSSIYRISLRHAFHSGKTKERQLTIHRWNHRSNPIPSSHTSPSNLSTSSPQGTALCAPLFSTVFAAAAFAHLTACATFPCLFRCLMIPTA